MRRSLQNGFTLIELMIVVAIIGILAALALPAYSDFMVRSRLSEVLGGMSSCRLTAVDFYLSNSGWDVEGGGPNISTLGMCDGPATRFTVLNGMTIDNAGMISAQTQNLGGEPADAVVTLRPVLQNNQIVSWICGALADGTTLEGKYKPGSCQG